MVIKIKFYDVENSNGLLSLDLFKEKEELIILDWDLLKCFLPQLYEVSKIKKYICEKCVLQTVHYNDIISHIKGKKHKKKFLLVRDPVIICCYDCHLFILSDTESNHLVDQTHILSTSLVKCPEELINYEKKKAQAQLTGESFIKNKQFNLINIPKFSFPTDVTNIKKLEYPNKLVYSKEDLESYSLFVSKHCDCEPKLLEIWCYDCNVKCPAFLHLWTHIVGKKHSLLGNSDSLYAVFCNTCSLLYITTIEKKAYQHNCFKEQNIITAENKNVLYKNESNLTLEAEQSISSDDTRKESIHSSIGRSKISSCDANVNPQNINACSLFDYQSYTPFSVGKLI